MSVLKSEVLDEIADYYSSKFAEHGKTPRGVDWNGLESQTLRFEQLCKIIPEQEAPFSLIDLGCGYGALCEFLMQKYPQISYLGLDVSAAMITAAKAHYAGLKNAQFTQSDRPGQISDYCVASGIFNVRQQRSDTEWASFFETTLDLINQNSRRGFAFNCLTAYSDADKKRDYLYYADPCRIFDLCKRKYSRDVALLHDYGLYEFTIMVRK